VHKSLNVSTVTGIDLRRPSGKDGQRQPSLRDLGGSGTIPALKRRAIFRRPSGTETRGVHVKFERDLRKTIWVLVWL
jgi:hypothetical protein